MSNQPVDMRKSIDGLSILVADVFQKNPISNYLFLFRNKHGDKIKILYWDTNGFCLWYKRLEKGRYKFAKDITGCFEIDIKQLRWLLDGLDFTKLSGYKELYYDNFY